MRAKILMVAMTCSIVLSVACNRKTPTAEQGGAAVVLAATTLDASDGARAPEERREISRDNQITSRELAGMKFEGPLESHLYFLSDDKVELVPIHGGHKYKGTYKVEEMRSKDSIIRMEYKSDSGEQKAGYQISRGSSGVKLTLRERTAENLPTYAESPGK